MRRALIALSLLLPLSVDAHAVGVSHEAYVDGIHIDIAYSSAAPTAGESVIFDFNLPLEEEDERYTDVWVRVDGEDGSVKLATAVYNAEFGGPRLSYVFSEAGTYTLSARYENEGEVLVKTEWPITVVPARENPLASFAWYIYLLGGVLVGACVVLASRHLRSFARKTS
jgi:hypothetical protein